MMAMEGAEVAGVSGSMASSFRFVPAMPLLGRLYS